LFCVGRLGRESKEQIPEIYSFVNGTTQLLNRLPADALGHSPVNRITQLLNRLPADALGHSPVNGTTQLLNRLVADALTTLSYKPNNFRLKVRKVIKQVK
jgi:hypothetical protein